MVHTLWLLGVAGRAPEQGIKRYPNHPEGLDTGTYKTHFQFSPHELGVKGFKLSRRLDRVLVDIGHMLG